ncbi:MAG: sugar ABC transporter substrate-binding protein [Firmicutes bacterium]|nr:sugar ABC transporter substrate-binding protein [Bacillota bacterium]
MSLKRTVSILLLLSLLVVGAFTAQAKEVTTIRYAFWGNPVAIGVEQDIIDAFHEVHPEIKVIPTAVAYGDYHTKLLTQIAGGMAPDVMRIDSYFFADFMKTGAVHDITNLIERDNIDMDLYYEAGLLDSLYNGRYYGLPWGTAPLYMIVNIDMFEEAGLPLPDPDWDWDEFLNIIKVLSKGEGTKRQYGFGFESNLVNLFPWIWGSGADLFDENRTTFALNDPRAVAVFDTFANMVAEKLIPDPANFLTPEVLNRWTINNAVGMRMGSAQEILALQQAEGLRFIVLPMPGGNEVKNTTVYKSNTVSISESSKNKEAAWTFLKFLRGPGLEGEKLYMQANRIPPTFNVPELWEIFADPTKHPKNIVEMTQLIASEYAHILPLRPGWNEFTGIIEPELQKVFAGQVAAQEAMDKIAPRVQEVLDRTE